MLTQLNTFLSENCPDWGLSASGNWDFWFYNNSHSHATNLDIMWFHGDDDFPRVVTKLDRKPDALAREFENLSRVHSCVPEHSPRPLNFGPLGQFWALWMEGLPGLPLPQEYSSQSLGSIVDMLLTIHSGVRETHRKDEFGRYRRLVEEPLEDVGTSTTSPSVRTGCTQLLREIDKDWLNSLPIIPQHGDLYPGNVILSRNRLHVLDWETFGIVDLPLYDLMTFLVSPLITDGATPSNLDPKAVQHMPPAVGRYAARMGLTISDLELLLPLTLINWYRLMKVDGREKFPPRMLRLIDHYFEHTEIWRRTFLPVTCG